MGSTKKYDREYKEQAVNLYGIELGNLLLVFITGISRRRQILKILHYLLLSVYVTGYGAFPVLRRCHTEQALEISAEVSDIVKSCFQGCINNALFGIGQ